MRRKIYCWDPGQEAQLSVFTSGQLSAQRKPDLHGVCSSVFVAQRGQPVHWCAETAVA